MATGAWAPNASTNKKIRLMLELSYSGDPASGSVTVRKIVKAQCDYRISDTSNTFGTDGVGGTQWASKDLNFPSSNSTITLYDGTSDVSLNYGSTKTLSASASITGIDYIGSSVRAIVSETIILPARPYTTPSSVDALTSTRSSDTRNNLSWTNNNNAAGYYEGIRIFRSVNGGAFVQIATLAGSATGYADTTTSANNYYLYQVHPYNSTGSASAVTSNYTYNTPAAPNSLAAVKTGATTVGLTWVNPANTETATEIQRSSDSGATWTAAGSTASNATAYSDDSVPGGTVIYRVRNTRDSLVSEWSANSNSVATLTAPAAPTLIDTPGTVVPSDFDTVDAKWMHNSLDGSAQTAAEIEVTRNGVTTTTSVSTANEYGIDISTLATGQDVSYRVRTKGLHESFSPWSSLYTFTVKDAPQVIITIPTDDAAVITGIPLTIEWDYIDATALAEWNLELELDGQIVHRASGTTGDSYTLDEYTYLLDNLASYALTLNVRSGSSLTASAQRLFAVDFAPPADPVLEATVDGDTGSVQLAAFFGEEAGAPEASHLSLARVDEDRIISLGSNMSEGIVIIDPLPLLNRANTYRVTAHTDTGLISTLDLEVDVQVGPWFIWNFGDGLMKTAKLKGNPSWSHNFTTEQELFAMAGRTYPVLMAGRSLGETIDFAGTARTDEQRAELDELALWAKKAVYREPHGIRKNVKAQVSSSEGGGPRKTQYAIKMEVVD